MSMHPSSFRAVLLALARLPAGHIDMAQPRAWFAARAAKDRGGWIEVVKDSNGDTSFMWTTSRDTHWPFGPYGGALSLTVSPQGELVVLMRSAVSMHVYWDSHSTSGPLSLARRRQEAVDFALWIHERLVAKGVLQPLPENACVEATAS